MGDNRAANRADCRTGCDVRAVRVGVAVAVIAVVVIAIVGVAVPVIAVVVIAVAVLTVVVAVRTIAVLVWISTAAGRRDTGGDDCRKTKLSHRLVLPHSPPAVRANKRTTRRFVPASIMSRSGTGRGSRRAVVIPRRHATEAPRSRPKGRKCAIACLSRKPILRC